MIGFTSKLLAIAAQTGQRQTLKGMQNRNGQRTKRGACLALAAGSVAKLRVLHGTKRTGNGKPIEAKNRRAPQGGKERHPERQEYKWKA